MKSYIIASLAAAVSAHSWLECTMHDNSQLRGWMEGNSTLSPPVIIDPAMPWYSQFCTGWPRNKANPGNWLDESSNYVWNIGANSWNGGSYHPPDTHACPPNQRSPTYQANAPMATASPGGMIRLRYGGNGHARGAPMGDAGTVAVYWKGKPETEITDISEFTSANLLQTAGFAADSFSYPADPKVISPIDGLVDKGNWMELKLPADMAPGRHMMVWVWSYTGAPQWSTCFDVQVSDSAAAGSSTPKVATAKQANNDTPATPPIPAAPVVNAKAPEYSAAAAAPEYSAPAAVPEYSAPAAAPQYDTPVAAPQYDTPVAAPQYDTPAAAPQYDTPAAAPQYDTPAAVPQYDTTAAAPKYDTPAPPAAASNEGQEQSPAEGRPKRKHCRARHHKRGHSRSFA